MPTSPSSGFRLWFARFPLYPPNRRMRTRMYGGVAGESGRPFPLCRFAVKPTKRGVLERDLGDTTASDVQYVTGHRSLGRGRLVLLNLNSEVEVGFTWSFCRFLRSSCRQRMQLRRS